MRVRIRSRGSRHFPACALSPSMRLTPNLSRLEKRFVIKFACIFKQETAVAAPFPSIAVLGSAPGRPTEVFIDNFEVEIYKNY